MARAYHREQKITQKRKKRERRTNYKAMDDKREIIREKEMKE